MRFLVLDFLLQKAFPSPIRGTLGWFWFLPNIRGDIPQKVGSVVYDSPQNSDSTVYHMYTVEWWLHSIRYTAELQKYIFLKFYNIRYTAEWWLHGVSYTTEWQRCGVSYTAECQKIVLLYYVASLLTLFQKIQNSDKILFLATPRCKIHLIWRIWRVSYTVESHLAMF